MKKTLLLLAAFVLLSPAPRASACLNEMEEEVDVVAEVRRAERLLASGRLRQAYRVAYAAEAQNSIVDVAIQRRRSLILATAVIRLDGHVPGRHTNSPAARVQNSIRALRAMHRENPDYVLIVVRLAEGLAKSEDTRAEALTLIEPFANVLPDVHAHATLASLYQHAGRTDDARAARERCLERARGRQRSICRAPGRG